MYLVTLSFFFLLLAVLSLITASDIGSFDYIPYISFYI